MADLSAAQENVRKIILGGGTERDINEYLSMVGVKAGQLRAFSKRKGDYGFGDYLESTVTFGIGDRVKALGRAVGDEVREARGKAPAAGFGDRYGDELEAERRARDAYASENPGKSALGMGLGLFGGAGNAATALNLVPAAVRSGAATAGLAGFGNAEGSVLDQIKQTALATLLGSGLGYGIGRLGQRAQARPPRPRPGQEAAAAADRQGITLNPADVRPGLRDLQAAVEGTPIAGNVVTQGIQRNVQSVDNAVQRIAGTRGAPANPGDPTEVGNVVQTGARRFIDRSRDTVRRIYQRAEQMSQGVTVDAAQARTALQGHLDELRQTPNTNGAAITAMEGLLGDLGQPLSVQAVRNLRTATRDRFISDNLRGTNTERLVGEVLDAASDDIQRTLQSTSPQAAAAFRRADAAWRARAARIDGAIERILGRDGQLGAEQAAARLKQMAGPKGDSAHLGQIMRSLSAEERGDVAASVISSLGRRAPDAPFTIDNFLTQYRTNLTDTARQALFGREGATALDNVATAARAIQESAARLNRSQSGNVLTYRAALAALFGGVGYSQDGVSGAGVGIAAGGYGLSRMLTSPAFARWLGRAVQARTPQAVQNQITQLSQIASRETAISDNVIQFQDYLTRSLERAPLKAAAGEEEGDARPVPVGEGEGEGPAPDPRQAAISVRLGGQ